MLTILALSAGITLYGPTIVDMVKASQYRPSAEMTTVTQRLKLSDRGTQVFYATNPTIEGKDRFNISCQSEERTAAILGCYYHDRTYLFDMQNKELDGAIEVTAAHEMLHAAYHRLNMLERPRINDLITMQYNKIKDQPDIKEAMAYYAKAEPGAEIDELHSIIGTTVSLLDPELEQYYARYFQDRAAVVTLNQQYTKVFADISKRSAELQGLINIQGPEIKADLAAYDTDRTQVETDIASFNARATSGGFSSQQSFQIARSALVARVDALNTRRDQINARVDAFNKLVVEINTLSTRAGELNQSINGATSTAGVQ